MNINIQQQLFDILRTNFDTSVKTLTRDGKETDSTEEAEMFSFDFVFKNNNYGPVVILLSTDNKLEIYYGDNTGRSLVGNAKKKWEGFIEHMSRFAQTHRHGFGLKHIKNLKYDLSNIIDANINESYKNIFESYYGTNKTSYQNRGNAKIIIKHSKTLGEDDARFRNINSIFIENVDGERFKLPFKKLAGARAMARHVTEGGNPYDLFGLHISEIVKDINTLGGFVRRSKVFEENDETAHLVETGKTHYGLLRKTLNRLGGKRGYHQYKKNWNPAEIKEEDQDISEIRNMFVERSVDQRIEEALPLIAKLEALAKKQQPDEDINEVIDDMSEVSKFESWANEVVNEVEHTEDYPTSKFQFNKLKEFFKEEQPLGVDAINVINSLSGVIHSDKLNYILSKEAHHNPDLDGRPFVKKWLDAAIANNKIPKIIK